MNLAVAIVDSAAKHDYGDVVKLLISGGAAPNTSCENGKTPLYWASCFGNMYIVKMLLDVGANCQIENAKGETPLYWASKKGHKDVVDLLINAGAHK